MSDGINSESSERSRGEVSFRTVTSSDFDFIRERWDKDYGLFHRPSAKIARAEDLRRHLAQTEQDALDGKQLLSFISYVGDKPAGCVIIKRDPTLPYEAEISSFNIAREFRSNPTVLLTMFRHLLQIREEGRSFTFNSPQTREDTLYRVIGSTRLQDKLRDFGYTVEAGPRSAPRRNPYHPVTLRPIQK